MNRRISYERLGWLATELTPRDREVVAVLARLHLVSGSQLRRLYWPEPGPAAERAARRAIDRLVRWRVLARLERRVGGVGRGSASWTLALDTAGQRLVAGGEFPNARRPHLPRPAMWHHALSVSETYVRLAEATGGTHAAFEWEGEPASWRTFSGVHGEAVTLKPDGMVAVQSDGYEDRWAIELDTGSQSRPVIRRKCDSYLRYLATGQEQAAHSVFPRVAFIATRPERVDLIADLLRSRPEREWPLFAIAHLDDAGRLLAGDWSGS